MLVGTEGGVVTVMAKQLGALVPHGPTAETQILPDVTPGVTVTEVVPCPELMVHPAGTVQL